MLDVEAVLRTFLKLMQHRRRTAVVEGGAVDNDMRSAPDTRGDRPDMHVDVDDPRTPVRVGADLLHVEVLGCGFHEDAHGVTQQS
ncbi:MAG: hypothetical protein U0R27_05855 [Candidatus Nanopelagicales bacterium]